MAWVRTHPLNSKLRLKMGVMPDFSGASQISAEVPTGEMDGVNRRFTLQREAIAESLVVYKDGMRLKPSTSSDFSDGDYWFDEVEQVLWLSIYHIPQADKGIVLVDYRAR